MLYCQFVKKKTIKKNLTGLDTKNILVSYDLCQDLSILLELLDDPGVKLSILSTALDAAAEVDLQTSVSHLKRQCMGKAAVLRSFLLIDTKLTQKITESMGAVQSDLCP